MFKKIHKHEYDPFFYGLVIAKSKALYKYVQEHKSGSDYARQRIIEAKYGIAKVHPILHGMYKRGLKYYQRYSTDYNKFLVNIDTIGLEFIIMTDNFDKFRLNHHKDEVQIDSKYTLTSDELNAKVFLSVYNAIKTKKENSAQIDFNIESRAKIAEYEKKYTREFP
jgi:hypothetical protein